MTKFYMRPNRITRIMNACFSSLAARGLGPKKTVELQTIGRKSGLPRKVAVNIINFEGKRYLVAPRGNTEWARNAAINSAAVIKRGKLEDVTLAPIPEGGRAPILQAYLRDNAIVTRHEFGIDPKSPIEEFEKIAPKHPVFRIDPRPSG